MREQGSSDEEIARRLRFKSAEEMRARLHGWELPDWLVGEKTNSDKKRVHQKSTPRRLRSFGPPKELPPAGNATELFKERLEALLESAELLKQIDEGLYGRYFGHANVETAPVFWPRERYSKNEWDKLCEQYGLDPEDKGFWDTKVLVRLPGGAACRHQKWKQPL